MPPHPRPPPASGWAGRSPTPPTWTASCTSRVATSSRATSSAVPSMGPRATTWSPAPRDRPRPGNGSLGPGRGRSRARRSPSSTDRRFEGRSRGHQEPPVMEDSTATKQPVFPRLTEPRVEAFWNVPNVLTLSRLGLSIVVFALVANGRYWSALVVFVVAALTDALDGYFA